MARATRGFWDWVMERVMPFMVERNYSMQGALNWLNSRGIEFSERRFVKAYRDSLKNYYDQPKISALPMDKVVPKNLITTRDFPRPRRYMYHVKMVTVDPNTGKRTLRKRAFYSSRNMVVDKILSTALHLWGWDYQNYGVITQGVQLDFVEENEVWAS